MDEDKYAQLIYNKHKSTDFDLLIKYPFNLVHATPDLNPLHIKGRSGDFLQDDNSYQNITETFDCIASKCSDVSQIEWERKVVDWLTKQNKKQRTQYQYLQFSVDPDYVFNAAVQTLPTFTWDGNDPNLVTGQITFYCEPFMYRIDSIKYKNLPNSGVFYNEEMWTSVPNWHFIANGTFSLMINELAYEFDNMSGEFWLNGDTGDTYDNKGTLLNGQTKFPNLLPPELKPGKNTISITAESNAITKAEFMPRLRRLI